MLEPGVGTASRAVATLPPLLDPYGELFDELRASGALRDSRACAEIRRKLVWAYAWAVPTREAIDALAGAGPLLEIGAGSGYWAWLLRQAGVDVLAFDREVVAAPRWSEVWVGGAEMAARHPDRGLFLCWPPMPGMEGESLAYDSLSAYAGDRVCVIGEAGEAARTGDARFRALLADRFRLEREVAVRSWPGWTDQLGIYRRDAG